MSNVTPPGERPRLPRGFHLGRGDGRLPDRGRHRRRRPGPSVWDTFSHDAGQGARRRHRRHRLRLLPPLPRGRRPDALPRPVRPTGSRSPGRGSSRTAAGRLNQPGSTTTSALLDALAERGIAAAATLYHWDLPQALQDQRRLGRAGHRVAVRRLRRARSPRRSATGSTRWITLNEPLVVAHNGHRIGVHAPGLRDDAAAAAATHHLLLGHGLATAGAARRRPAARGRHHPRPDPGPGRAGANGSAEALERARLVADATHNGAVPRAGAASAATRSTRPPRSCRPPT